MAVQFSVDAYPGETFAGQVTEILLNPTKTQNCATYTVVVATSNSHGMLPYLTAKLRFQIDRRRRAEPTCDIALQRRPRSAPAVCATASGNLPGQAADKRPSPVPGRAALPKPPNPGKKLAPKAAGQV